MATEGAAETDKRPGEAANASRRWLAMIEDGEKALKEWQSKADTLDKLYANLTALAAMGRDRQFQMFWANIQVLGPSIYARPPVPVVVPRFKDRRPVPRTASELLERCTVVGFELEDIDGIMRQVRDDLTVVARGAAWVRYDTKDGQRVCIDFADRKDFLHGPARVWKEVPWVAKRSWLTREQAEKRFGKDKTEHLAYEERRLDEDGTEKFGLQVGVWELWHKGENKVVWVAEGCNETLDEDEPHLKLEGFFPCPRPAFGTLQRRSLVPVPDMLFYKDQLEEINELTEKIAALSDALKVRGFYHGGAGDLSDAIEIAVKNADPNAVLVPVNNVAALSGQAFKDAILWLPIEVIAATIVQLVAIRKQVIDDVYQIQGLSDIMRGSTDPDETLGAQELKGQYGSVRVRDKQAELVRFARDLVRIAAEIMAESFTSKTMLDMSQLEIRTDAEVKKDIEPLEKQINAIIANVEKAKNDPQIAAQAQANPEQAQQILAQAKQQAQKLKSQIEELNEEATVEKVMKLLRDQRVRPFVLDIETDSTIAPDENAQKQRATEFITAVGGFMNQAIPLVQMVPQASKLTAETLKYVAGQFRAGRQLEGVIEEFADDMAQMAANPQESPEAAAAKAQAQAAQLKAQQDAEKHMRDQQSAELDQKRKDQEAVANQDREERKLAAAMEEKDRDEARKVEQHRVALENAAADRAEKAQQHAQNMEKGALEIEKLSVGIQSTLDLTDAKIDQGEAAADAKEAAATDGKPKRISRRQQRDDKLDGVLVALAQGQAALAATMAAPKRVVRGPNNEVIGIEPVYQELQ